MVTITEGIHEIGSHSLYTKTWIPDGIPKAKLIFVHGYSDHINRYYELFPTLASRGIENHAFDQRGWGRSVHKPSEKGLTGPTSLVMSDIVSFIKTVLPCPVPLFLLGHSMGGAEVLTLASDPQYDEITRNFRGVLLEAPYIALPKALQPSFLKVFGARLVAKVLPKFTMFERLPPEQLTRRPDVAKDVDEDKLHHNTGTVEGLANMLDRAEALDQGKAKLSKEVKSLWLGHGTADNGASFEASKRWFERQTELKDKEFKTYEGAFHMLHADLPETSNEFYKDVGDWILARCEDETQRQVPGSRL